MAQYGKVEYWNERYQLDQESFSWYQKYSGFRHLLTPDYLSSGLHEHKFPDRKSARVLILGCGNDNLGEAMLADGWEGGIVNVDYSYVVIQQMREKYDDEFYASLEKRIDGERKLLAANDEGAEDGNPGLIKMAFDCHDVTKPLPYADGSFDLIVCKGTFDAILCSDGSIANARAFMEEACRLLNKDHGALCNVTYGNKEARLVYYENNPADEWWRGGVAFHTIPKPEVPGADVGSPFHFVIISKKHGIGGPSGIRDKQEGYVTNDAMSISAHHEAKTHFVSNNSGKSFLAIPEEPLCGESIAGI